MGCAGQNGPSSTGILSPVQHTPSVVLFFVAFVASKNKTTPTMTMTMATSGQTDEGPRLKRKTNFASRESMFLHFSFDSFDYQESHSGSIRRIRRSFLLYPVVDPIVANETMRARDAFDALVERLRIPARSFVATQEPRFFLSARLDSPLCPRGTHFRNEICEIIVRHPARNEPDPKRGIRGIPWAKRSRFRLPIALEPLEFRSSAIPLDSSVTNNAINEPMDNEQ